MRRRGLRVAWYWCLGAAAVGAVAWGIVRGSPGVGMAMAGAIGLVLACDMYFEAMTQSREDGLATTRAHKVWLLVLCVSAAATIIGFPVNVLTGWYLHDLRAGTLERLKSAEIGVDAPDFLSPHSMPTAAVRGALAAVSLTSLWRWIIRPHELWRAAAPSDRRRSGSIS